ncbi:MAG: hypothetical protein U0136_01195 [Bdellovibrionota bacterium]
MKTMRSGPPKRKTYLVFRRYMSGIKAACILVTLVGSFVADVSFVWIAARATLVWCAIAFIEWVLIKTWTAWEITNASSSATGNVKAR